MCFIVIAYERKDAKLHPNVSKSNSCHDTNTKSKKKHTKILLQLQSFRIKKTVYGYEI